MKALDFSHNSFFHYEYYYHDLLEHYTSLPSTTTHDFWKDTTRWMSQGRVSYSKDCYSFTNKIFFSSALFFLTSSVTLLNDLTGMARIYLW